MKITPFHTPPPLRAERGVPVDVDAEDRDFDKFVSKEVGAKGQRSSDRGRGDSADANEASATPLLQGVHMPLVVHPWPRALTPGAFAGVAHAGSPMLPSAQLRDRLGLGQGVSVVDDVIVTISAADDAFAVPFADVDRAADDDDDEDLFDPAGLTAVAGVDVNAVAVAVDVAAAPAVADVNVDALEAAVEALHDPAARLQLDLNTATLLVEGLHVRVSTHGDAARVVVEGKDAAAAVAAARDLDQRLATQGLHLDLRAPTAVAAAAESAAGGNADRHGAAVVDVDEDARVEGVNDGDDVFADTRMTSPVP
jgi:hypothetical protein